MTFKEIRFPESIAMGAKGGPEFATNIVAMKSGREQRNSDWSTARCSYDVATGIKSEEDLSQLLAFFRVVKGRAIGFRFKDWLDYSATGENIGIGDAVGTQFQLIKNYSFGDFDYSRTINKPITTGMAIYLDGVKILSGYSLDMSSGIITFDVPPEDGVIVTADFEFDVPVRFDIDKLNVSLTSLKSGEIEGIKLIEVKI